MLSGQKHIIYGSIAAPTDDRNMIHDDIKSNSCQKPANGIDCNNSNNSLFSFNRLAITSKSAYNALADQAKEEEEVYNNNNDEIPSNALANNAENKSTSIYKLSPERWYILAAFCCLSFSNAWMWITWSPMVDLCMETWNVSDADVDALSSVYMYGYIPLALPVLSGVNQYGLKWGLYCAAILNFVGSFIRYIGISSYGWVYVGTLCCSFAQVFTLSMPPFIAGEWFGSHERAMATSIGVLANQSGNAAGMGATILVSVTEQNLWAYVLVQCLVALAGLIMVYSWVTKSRPSSPPSLARVPFYMVDIESSPTSVHFNFSEDFDEAAIRRLIVDSAVHQGDELGYNESLTAFFSDSASVAFAIIYGAVVGVFYAFCTFLSQYVSYSSFECGVLGFSFIAAGLLGPILSGKILDIIKCQRKLISGIIIGSLLTVVSVWIVIWFYPYNRFLVYPSLIISSVVLTALISEGFEYATALAYPVDENIVAGILNCFAQMFGWIMVYTGGEISNVAGVTYNGILSMFVLVSTVLFFVAVSEVKLRRPKD
mmetsp:Transcript_13631/g.20801  ORF Transcript_13631/g.20801 Transcript_13631/m.20801 type:complete len:542 (-) Transcript_13631:557-2182(-)